MIKLVAYISGKEMELTFESWDEANRFERYCISSLTQLFQVRTTDGVFLIRPASVDMIQPVE